MYIILTIILSIFIIELYWFGRGYISFLKEDTIKFGCVNSELNENGNVKNVFGGKNENENGNENGNGNGNGNENGNGDENETESEIKMNRYTVIGDKKIEHGPGKITTHGDYNIFINTESYYSILEKNIVYNISIPFTLEILNVSDDNNAIIYYYGSSVKTFN